MGQHGGGATRAASQVPRGRPLFATYPFPTRRWKQMADLLPAGVDGLQRIRYVLAAAATHRVLVLDGTSRPDMLAAGVIARRRTPPLLLILDATWKLGTNPVDRILTWLSVRTLDGEHVNYAVSSTFEVTTFPRTWHVSPDRVQFIPWFCTLSQRELQAAVTHDGGFFAGGNSLRDFGTLIEAAGAVPAPVTIASDVSPNRLGRMPPNVTLGSVTPTRYDELSRSATAVVLPLEQRPDRTSGQGTLLAAMALGKTLIVNDVAGVRDYVVPGETALVVPARDAGALAEAMRWVLENPRPAREIGERAQAEAARRYTAEAYADRVMEACLPLLR